MLIRLSVVSSVVISVHAGGGLDSKMQRTLQAAVETFCESIVEASFSDFQVALFGDERQVQDSLKEAGVSRFTLKQLQTWQDRTCFAVALSSREDLQKIVGMQPTYKPFQEMGVRLPSIVWVSKFSQKALESWKDHVRSSWKEADTIEYKESFGQEVAVRYEAGNNCFSAGGEPVEVRVCFSLVLFPINFQVSAEILQKALPGVQVDLASLMMLEGKGEMSKSGKMAILRGVAFNEIHSSLKHPKTLTLDVGEQHFSVVVVTLSDWVYTCGKLDVVSTHWENVQQEICVSVKQQVQKNPYA